MIVAITRPGATPAAGVEELILPSRQQSAAERLAIYSHAYLARLLDVLREQFPCTRFAVGDELFDQFASAYLHANPPHSYTLTHLADKLAVHLDATRPPDWGNFVVELIRLEQAIDRVFDAAGPERLPPFIVPADATGSIRLSFVPGFELHAFLHPVSSYYSDWKAGREPKWPEPSQQFVALLRRDYIVRRYELSAAKYHLLFALRGGATLGEALSAACEAGFMHSNDSEAEVRGWFAFWGGEQFFAAAE
jgi:hypothetical protein